MGWSGETESSVWQKADVEVDEDDVVRLLLEHDLPADIRTRLPTKLIFQLLQNEAEALLLHRLVGFGYPTGKAAARVAVVKQESINIADAIKQKLAVTA
jgi:hypothetical protein